MDFRIELGSSLQSKFCQEYIQLNNLDLTASACLLSRGITLFLLVHNVTIVVEASSRWFICHGYERQRLSLPAAKGDSNELYIRLCLEL
jgi:hypothetical protein